MYLVLQISCHIIIVSINWIVVVGLEIKRGVKELQICIPSTNIFHPTLS